jgi:hypothetical protein
MMIYVVVYITQGCLEKNTRDLTESSTVMMINKRNIIVNVKVNITVQRFEVENKVLDFSVVTKR